MSYATTRRSSGSTRGSASRWLRAWTPHPSIAKESAPGGARYFAVTAEAAAVRCCVSHVESITATTTPSSIWLRNSMPVMYGRPRPALDALPLCHFMAE